MLQILAQRGGFVYTEQPILVPSIPVLFKKYTEVLSKLPPEEHVNLYYTLAHHQGAEGASRPQRTTATFDYQTVLAFDIDQADGSKALEYAACVAAVLETDVSSLTVVASGNGIHVIAQLKTAFRHAKAFKELKPAYSEVCFKVGQKLSEAGLLGKVDPSIFEPARVLRLPGTINRKPDKEDKRCELVQYSDAILEIDLKKISGLAAAAAENISPMEIRRNYPQPDFGEIYKECKFVDWATAHPEEIHEPHAFDLFSLLVNMPPDATVLYQGREVGAKDLAAAVFENASASKSLARSIFDDKWAQAGRYGCRKCETIDAHWGRCSGCPHFGKAPTPLALKSPDHISSERTGYWVMDSNGRYQYPHYADLAKIYKREHSYVTSKDGRVFSFVGTHYTEAPPLTVKAWVENKVRPADPLREVHRNEFLHKIYVVGCMSPAAEEDLFDDSIRGRLNFKNGALDIMTGELLNHAPTIGFQYVLPYDYYPDQASEFFIDWLAQITEDRVELIESILDVMAYNLWPSFDDHMFTYLVGEGSNGKSTLINIIRSMLGDKTNCSSVNIHQLTSNRFAPADLEGKLVNMSEESSGHELTSDQLNVLKNLSSGGEMFIERKGEQGYSFRNKAKLIFSANKVPRFAEQGNAITRRLLVIPFDYRITDPDPLVEQKLLEDVPQILSMLVRRVQDNVMKNDGKFVVSRASGTLTQAQKKFLTAGNTVVQWADECIESSAEVPADKYITVLEAYARYKLWCEDSGVRYPVSKLAFGRYMSDYVVTKAVDGSETMRIKTPEGLAHVTRVYRRTRFVNGEAHA